jgi:hypothetical protein
MSNKRNRITHREPMRVCELCGHKYRLNDNMDVPYCSKCIKEMEKENTRADKKH